MKIPLILLLTALLAISLNAAPKINFEAVELSFGEIKSGRMVDLEFKFSNAGDSRLIIRNISSSCGCLTTKLQKKEYEPGESGILPVKFFSRGYNGKIVKSITVATNDPEKVYTRLKITGTVKLEKFAALEIDNDRIDFGEVRLNGKYEKTVVLKNPGTIELRIIEITHSPDVYPVFTSKVIKSNEETTVKLVFTPMQTGRFTTFIKVRSNAYRQPLTIIRVNAEVRE